MSAGRWLLFVSMFMAGVLFLHPLEVHADDTPPPSPTIAYCPATSTPTSVLPTFVLPTVDWSTSTPCPDGACPTAGPTLPPTNTPTITPTATAITYNRRIFYCGPATGQSPNNPFLGCTISPDGQSAVASISGSNIVGNSVEVWVSDEQGHMAETMVYLEYAWTAAYGGSPFDTNEALLHGSTLDQLTNYQGQTSRNWSGTYTWLSVSKGGTLFNAYANDMNSNHQPTVNGTFHFWIAGSQLTPTAIPSPTIAPCVEGNPNDGAVDGGGTKFTPPVIVSGSCFTIVPQLQMDVPSIVDWTISDVPSTIGIPGVEICTQYWVMQLSVFGFNIINAISSVVGFVCVAIIYRTFQN